MLAVMFKVGIKHELKASAIYAENIIASIQVQQTSLLNGR